MPDASHLQIYATPRRAARAGRVTDAATALSAIPDGARCLIPPLSGTPLQLLEALDGERHRWARLEVSGGILLEAIAPLAHAGAPFHFSSHQPTGPYRAAAEAGALEVIPATYAQLPGLFLRDGPLPADVVLVQVSPTSPDGLHSLGTSVGAMVDAVHDAPLVIGQVNERMPYTFGAGELPPDAFDFLVPLDGPLPALSRAAPSDLENAIAARVITRVADGATLQFGIGAVPEAIMSLLPGRRDLGIHSGLISDGVMDLAESGALTNKAKAFDTDAIVTAEAAGTEKFFRWLHRNPAVRMAPSRYTHGVPVIARHPRFTAINSAVQVALDGAVNAESVGGRAISGPGGQPDFALAATLSEQGVSIVALPSTASRGTVSRIVKQLDADAVVTVPRYLADCVATEYGIATLRGLGLRQRAANLRAVAHPDFRAAIS